MTEDAYLAHRALLFTVAYDLLGVAADAEDVVQEAWLRWSTTDQEAVRDPRAFLVRITSRLALDRLRNLARRREQYVGEWLPEPLLTTSDVADDVELAESVSMAMLVVLETLTPLERAVFVLREVFDIPYDEIGITVDRSPASVRQIAHRAREHVAARRPRSQVSPAEQRAVIDKFIRALQSGDVQALMQVLAPDVVLVADGGGRAPAAVAPVLGADQVARQLATGDRNAYATTSIVWLNGALAARIDTVDRTAAVSVVISDGRLTHIYAIANPEKLTRLDDPVELAR